MHIILLDNLGTTTKTSACHSICFPARPYKRHSRQSSRMSIAWQGVDAKLCWVVLCFCRRPRLLGAGPGSKVGADHVFGKPSARERQPCVGELIRSSGGREEQVDPGLGNSPTRWRNTSEPAERVSGRCCVPHASHQPRQLYGGDTRPQGACPACF